MFPKGTMYWGAIGPGYISPLIKCAPKERGTVDYLRILGDAEVVATLDARYGQLSYLFMSDGATCHTSQETIDMIRSRMKLIEGWLPNGPDLNPIEMLWAVIKGKLNARGVKTVRDIEEAIEQIWEQIDQGLIDKLVENFKRQLRLVIEMKGETISALLSSHMDSPPALLLEELANKPDPVLITAQEGKLMMELHQSLGNGRRLLSVPESIGHGEK